MRLARRVLIRWKRPWSCHRYVTRIEDFILFRRRFGKEPCPPKIRKVKLSDGSMPRSDLMRR